MPIRLSGAGVVGLVLERLPVVVIVGMLLIDILGPILELPEAVQDLSLAGHYGEPMIGSWEPVGHCGVAAARNRRTFGSARGLDIADRALGSCPRARRVSADTDSRRPRNPHKNPYGRCPMRLRRPQEAVSVLGETPRTDPDASGMRYQIPLPELPL
jgi:hypothetical protein